jgi:hypothetical protein
VGDGGAGSVGHGKGGYRDAPVQPTGMLGP